MNRIELNWPIAEPAEAIVITFQEVDTRCFVDILDL